MHSTRTLLIAAAALALAACGRLERRGVAGSYVLLTRNGQALPAPNRYSTDSQDCKADLVSGNLSLRADGKWVETLVNDAGCAPTGGTINSLPTQAVDSGNFLVRDDGSIEFRGGTGGTQSQLVGTLEHDTLKVELQAIVLPANTPFTFVYARQR